MDNLIPNTSIILVSLLSGLLLGGIYFYGLWMTVKVIPTTSQPVKILLRSFMGRSAITLGGFALLGVWHWSGLLFGLLGFLLMRMILIRSIGLAPISKSNREERPFGNQS